MYSVTGSFKSLLNGAMNVKIGSQYRDELISQGAIPLGAAITPTEEIHGDASFYTGGANCVKVTITGGAVHCNDGGLYPIASVHPAVMCR